MRCYYNKFSRDIQFDKTRYQQFLTEQGLNERDITHLNICFITDFTHAHFMGSPAFAAGGAFFQRDREYIEKMNETALGLYRPYYSSRAYNERNQPWEIDAEEFARRYVNQACFFLPVSRPLKRSDLRW
jgi:hypothetical protein